MGFRKIASIQDFFGENVYKFDNFVHLQNRNGANP